MFAVQQIDHVALTVRDVQRSVAWYQDVLGLQRRHQETWGDYPAVVYAGSTGIALFPATVPHAANAGRLTTMRHLAFKADRANFLLAQETLKARGIAFRFEDHSISQSIYFHDPDGHEIEITTYEL
jgi:catechol 2,3-dioxygenase-like lactoylglutathione lyase family enzyme